MAERELFEPFFAQIPPGELSEEENHAMSRVVEKDFNDCFNRKRKFDGSRVSSLLNNAAERKFPLLRDVSQYEVVLKVGEGTFGEVFKARDKSTMQMVALKKMRLEREKNGFPITAMREIRSLKKLRHENIIQLIEVCKDNDGGRHTHSKSTVFNFYLVFEFCDHDLAGLLLNNVPFSESHVKSIIQQIFRGLEYIHANNHVHRDLKCSNILVSKLGVVKIADFGLIREQVSMTEFGDLNSPFDDEKPLPPPLTLEVVTLWYRPPEIILGQRCYGSALDCWAAGCILAELFIRKPLLPGESEAEQMELITRLCGSISSESWPGCEKLGKFGNFTWSKEHRRKLRERLMSALPDALAVDLVDKLLCLDPDKRLSCADALKHVYFCKQPPPAGLDKLLRSLPKSCFEMTAPSRPTAQQQAKLQRQQQQELTFDSVYDRVF